GVSGGLGSVHARKPLHKKDPHMFSTALPRGIACTLVAAFTAALAACTPSGSDEPQAALEHTQFFGPQETPALITLASSMLPKEHKPNAVLVAQQD
ncbi:hypothetical protein NQ024_10615, partial [Corynebacterium sp. 35RC1]|nr:hypothetical protein [Corynebacterium sp. 35RC1]